MRHQRKWAPHGGRWFAMLRGGALLICCLLALHTVARGIDGAANWLWSCQDQSIFETLNLPWAQQLFSLSGGTQAGTTAQSQAIRLFSTPLTRLSGASSDSSEQITGESSVPGTVSQEETSQPEQQTEIPEGCLPIEAITIAPTDRESYLIYNDVYMSNRTDYTPDLKALLEADIPFRYESSAIQVLIVHTHGTESYAEEGAWYYDPDAGDRSEDTSKSVVRVGDEVAQVLEEAGIGVVHDRELHDLPAFNQSYPNTLTAIESYLKQYPDIAAVIDIHRDGLISDSGVKYAPITTDEEGNRYAQMALVMGTDACGLLHDDWQQNLKLALKLQNDLNKAVPNLMRPLSLRTDRLNQHATANSLLIEIGSCGNSLSEALRSARLFAAELAQLLKGT